jgi:hypothetical protein
MKLGTRLQLFIVLAVVALTTACTIDVTKSEGLNDYAGQCFVSIYDAMFVSRECKNGVWTNCDTVRPIAKHQIFRFKGYPSSVQEYRDDPVGWSESIHELEKSEQPLLAPDHIVVYGAMPLGTSFKVTRILSQFDGENGRYWDVYAGVQNGEFKGRNVLLPTTSGAIFNFDYLARCDGAKPGAGH